MTNRIGIRLEDKNEWERRVALTPVDVGKVTARGVPVYVERFARRAYLDNDYFLHGAMLVDDVRPCEIVLGIKEMPIGYFREGGAYMFFSHTIKGQPYNMKMLARLVELKCTLFDYEVVTDEKKRRLIFFGRYAGLAGMIDTFWALGQRLAALGHTSPFLHLEPAHRYDDLEAAKAAVSAVGEIVVREGLPEIMAPAVVGFTGYGNVSSGAQEIFDLLPHVEVSPDELGRYVAENGGVRDKLAKVVYREEHLVERTDGEPFDLQHYYAHGEAYRSIFEPHLSLLTVLVNGIYWDEKYPKLADADQLQALFAGGRPRLLAVGDITCDVDGSLACTVRDTEPGDPCYVYDPGTGEAPSGFEGPGLAVMAVGNLPAELPREASDTFSEALYPFVSDMFKADLSAPFDTVSLPGPIKRSTILWNGELTPDFEYMREYLR
ncbi:MAG: hypothetical protein JRI55_28645 [Deltaproteobacteria bacterium]|jgi:alpha-aminoadipic semialdehyde synthase|nr:hypothetical protein [Deltaproteobacteria bacterium]